MARNYYYLVAGLPDIILDGGKKGVSAVAFFEEITEQLHPADVALLNFLRYPVDNRNLLFLLEKSDRPFDTAGVFPPDELAENIKMPDTLPAYMQSFIEAHKDGRQIFPGYSPENQIEWLFYEEACAHRNEFIREWFGFDRDLRNVLAALSCRASKENSAPAFELKRAIAGNNDIAEAILKSTAPDFSLSAQLPWIERITGANRDNLVEFEKTVDTLRWETLNDMTVFSYFQIETLLAFFIKISMAQRWAELDEDEGAKRFNRLVEELTSGFSLNTEQ